ncbi:protein kinase domain-containing protein [Streptomyces exfoliatus]|uniref:protein kinase domain-containing protein n=1 Tax=Streptomyces exfoliatus TaxID=1905 RepID=UPI003C2F0A1C
MKWFRRAGRPRGTAPGGGALRPDGDGREHALSRSGIESAGREGDAEGAARGYRHLVVQALQEHGADHPVTLALRHQLAHWTGEAGRPDQAWELFGLLLQDRLRLQGEAHPDVHLCAHQVAHWLGRAGRIEEAVSRYVGLYELTRDLGQHAASLQALCDLGHWQQQAGDTKAALRSFRMMQQDAVRHFGTDHQLADIARTRYAELAGDLPFGTAGGREAVESLLKAAAGVAAAGDAERAARLYERAAERAATACGEASDEYLTAVVGAARQRVEAGANGAAADAFGKVMACMRLRGEEGGTEYAALGELREQLLRAASRERAEDGPAAPSAAPSSSARPLRPVPTAPTPAYVHEGAEALGGWRTPDRARGRDGGRDQGGPLPDAGARFGPYRVLEEVGRGGFGRVFLGQDDDGVLVAVKTLHPELARQADKRDGFAREVTALRRVDSRYVVPVVAADTGTEVPWMAVPFVSDPSLQEVLAEHGSLDPAVVRTLGAGVAHALAAIHAAGVVHLDLKPGNILLGEDRPRVIDFGIAQLERLAGPRRGFTGTYSFAAPEQLTGEGELTGAADVFALGTTLVWLALGHGPWGRGEPLSVAWRICATEPDLAGLPRELSALVSRCLAKNPADRPTAAEVARDLAPGTVEPPPPQMPRVTRDFIRAQREVPATRRLTARDTAAAEGRTTEPLTLPAPDAAERLETEVRAWERATQGSGPAAVLAGCADLLREAERDLGRTHPLSLRLAVSYALLDVGAPGGYDRAVEVVAFAAGHLGTGHPAVDEATRILAVLKPR